MSDPVWTIGILGAVVGSGLSVIAVIGMVTSVRDRSRRLLASGLVFVGMSLVAASAAVLLISRLGDRLPVIAGLPAIGLLLGVALVLLVGASRQFRRSGSSGSE